MSNWDELTYKEKEGKMKNLEKTKDTLFLFRNHDGSLATRKHGKYVKIKKNLLGKDVIVLEDVTGRQSRGIPLSDIDVSLPPFEKETLEQEYERTQLQPESDGAGGRIVHIVKHPSYEEWLRRRRLRVKGGRGARKRKTRKKTKRKVKRKTKNKKIKKRKARNENDKNNILPVTDKQLTFLRNLYQKSVM